MNTKSYSHQGNLWGSFFYTLFVSFSIGVLASESAIATPRQASNTHPNQNRFLQPQLLPQQLAQNPPEENSYAIETIEVVESTVFTEEDFAPILNPLEGKTVTLAELSEAVRAVTQLYLNDGYLTSRAVLVKDSLDTGNLKILVLEGKISNIEIEGLETLNRGYIRSRLELATEPVLNTTRLEEQLRLLRTNPVIETIEASLIPSEEQAKASSLSLRIEEASPWLTRLSLNNYSPPSVGGEKASLSLGTRNLTGNSDTLKATYSRTLQGGAEDIALNYSLPLNAKNGTIQLRTAFGRNEVIEEEFEDLNIEGDFDLVEISYRQPFIRTTEEEFALSLGFTYQQGQTFFLGSPQPFSFGPDEDGISRTSLIKFGQDYIKRSENKTWSLRSQFSLGTGLFNATTNEGDIPDGQFISWLGQAQRLQRLNSDHLLIIQADIQLASDELLPSQQFVIGGGQSVRGYRQNILAADQGIRLSVEDQITVSTDAAGDPVLQVAPFIEAGAVVNKGNNPNTTAQQQTVIAGLGLGILWMPLRDLDIRVDYGIPLVDLEDTGDNIQDDGLYFSLIYSP